MAEVGTIGEANEDEERIRLEGGAERREKTGCNERGGGEEQRRR